MPRKADLKGRSISELAEALGYVINQHLENIRFYQEMINTGDDIKIAKAYKDMRSTILQLRPIQYLVEQQAPGMKEVFKQFEGR